MDPRNYGNTPQRPNIPQNRPEFNPFFSQNASQFSQNYSQFPPNMYQNPQNVPSDPSQFPQNYSQFPPNMYPNFFSDPSYFQHFMMQMNPPQQQNPQNVEEDVAEIDPIQCSQLDSQSKKTWSLAEDEALISSYMNTSTDARIGTNQKRGDLWKKVAAAYKLAWQSHGSRIQPRNQESLKGRWRRISTSVTRWVGCIEEARKRKRSGMNDEDVIREAHIIYSHSYGGKFLFEKHWNMLEKYPKWETIVGGTSTPTSHPSEQPSGDTNSSGKRSRPDDDDIVEMSIPHVQCTQFNEDEIEIGSSNRPEGVKKAKNKGKKKVSGQSSELDAKWEKWNSTLTEKARLDAERLDKKMVAQTRADNMALFTSYAARGEDNLSEFEKKIYYRLARELGFDD